MALYHIRELGHPQVVALLKDSFELANEFVELGFKAVVTCVDTQALDKEFCGREFDAAFLNDLPGGVDPCGENGEFHTFAYAGPVFKEKIEFKKGEMVLRDKRFCFCDLVPAP
jgi:diphthamide synthase (EF-2-diphthine--ammonia ligase)